MTAMTANSWDIANLNENKVSTDQQFDVGSGFYLAIPSNSGCCKCCNMLGNMLQRLCQGHWPCCFQIELWSFHCTSILRRQKHGTAAATWPHEAQPEASKHAKLNTVQNGANAPTRTDTHRPFHCDSRLTKSNTCTVGRWKFGGRLACYQQAPSEEWPIFAYFCNLGVDPTTKHDVQTCLNVSANTTYSSDLSMFRGSGTLLTMA